MKLLILAPYPLKNAPSQRFRFEHYLKFMEENGIEQSFDSFLTEKTWNTIYSGNVIQKGFAFISGFLRRFTLLVKVNRFDVVFLHREITPFGPPIFEWVIAKALQKKIIYDFDDAIWMADQKEENALWKTLKWRSKVASVCSWSWKVTTGNEFLADFARQYCQHVEVIPTVVDTQIHSTRALTSTTKKPVIGWTGSHSTLPYLQQIIPVLQELEKTLDFTFVVIANRNPHLPLKNYQFVPWNKTTEIEDLAKLDIGIMPLPDDQWAQGKCGFKLIQYLALEMPAVASPVGVNTEIVVENETGFLATSQKEWVERLKTLLEQTGLRRKMGAAGRKLIEEKYSVEATKKQFLNLFQTS